MIIILHGADDFRSKIKLKEVVFRWSVTNKNNFNIEHIDAHGAQFSDIKNSIESTSLFNDSKLLVLKYALQNKKLLKELDEYKRWDSLLEDKNTTLVLFEEEPASANKFYKKILKKTKMAYEFKPLTHTQKIDWFAKFFTNNPSWSFAKKTKINNVLIGEVISACSGDMWQSYNELQKLLLYKKDSTITKKDIYELSIGSKDAQIFPTIDLIFSKKTNEALTNIQTHWSMGENPHAIFTMIERQLKLLSLIKEEADILNTPQNLIAKKTSLHPYVVKKTLTLTRNFSQERLQNLYKRVSSLDEKTKTGRLDPHLATELLVASIVA